MDDINKVNVNQLCSFIAEENNFNSIEVKDVFDSQFKFIANHIKKGKTEDVKLDYFGKFKKKVFIKKRNGIN